MKPVAAPSKRQATSIVLAFAGFAVLVLTFRGTWGKAYHALLGGNVNAKTTGGAGQTAGGQLAYPVAPGSLAYAGVTSGRPGDPPLPQRAPTMQMASLQPRRSSYVPTPIKIGGQTYYGQLTEGGKGETEFFSEKSQAVGGALSWQGPGRYTRLKMPPSVPGGGQDTEWVYAGA